MVFIYGLVKTLNLPFLFSLIGRIDRFLKMLVLMIYTDGKSGLKETMDAFLCIYSCSYSTSIQRLKAVSAI